MYIFCYILMYEKIGTNILIIMTVIYLISLINHKKYCYLLVSIIRKVRCKIRNIKLLK